MSAKVPFTAEMLAENAAKELTKQAGYRCRIFCCGSTACMSAGAGDILEIFQGQIKAHGLQKETQLVGTGCMGPCSKGPLVRVQAAGQEDTLYEGITPALAGQILERYALEEQPEPEANSAETDEPPSVRSSSQAELDEHHLDRNIPFFARQVKVVLANGGLIDPENINDYIAHGGYQALAKVLHEMSPEQVCNEILHSGLRGRGGAGYPTGLKWNYMRRAEDSIKYIVANGDEGDPGAYMDRTIMEDDPHRVLEGMAIAGYATGARHGFLYVRGEYPVAVQRLEKAIRAAGRKGILGAQVMDSDFGFEVELRIGAGAFVCGEETALMQSIQGNRGAPRMRPPYPAQKGLWGYPTLINNVETFANIAPIITNGAGWFAGTGTEGSKGTKVFALTGDLAITGLIEVPMGITLREIVEVIGGGVPGGRGFKAAQTGGPSGGCIPATHLDTPVDYESLKQLGSIMGSGGLVIIDDHNRMPDVAKFFMEFCVDESCGKCVPCRVGTVKMHGLLDKITTGRATAADLAQLEKLCRLVQKTSMCGLGQTAPNPVLSTLRYFRPEYEAMLVAENGKPN